VSNGAEIQHLRYSYDKVSNPVQIDSTLAGSAGGVGNGVWKMRYDAQNRLQTATGCQTTASNERSSYTEQFGYDDIHNIASKSRSHQVLSGSNCALASGGLKSAPPENNFNFTYTYDTNHAHRVSKVGDLTFQYDASGNVTKKGPQSYVWDDDNRMVLATTGNAQDTQIN
jgi:hypothetical protein